MNARRDLYAALMAGGPHSPERSERASALIDAFKAEARTEGLVEAEEMVRRSAAGWQQIETPGSPDHFKVIAAHALLIAEVIHRAAEEAAS